MQRATLAIVNGRVWGALPDVTAVAIAGEQIAATGPDAEIRAITGPKARVVDAAGGSILPAFNDAHVHFLSASRSLGELDLHGAQTEGEVERRVEQYTRRHTGPWIVGRGWFYSAFSGGMPTVELLDRLVPDRPAYIESFDAHTGWANSRALRAAGAPQGEVLKEGAMLQVTSLIPQRSTAEDVEALRDGMRLAASMGIGSVQEAGGGVSQLPLWETLFDRGELTVRVRLAFDMKPGLSMDDWASRVGAYQEARTRRGSWISTGILKAFADGVVESRTAAMLEPYAGSTERGAPMWDRGEFAASVRLADARGWQVQVHAIGDAAIRQALDAFEGTTTGRRHRIEHIETPDESDLPRFARLGVVASMQPQHADPGLTEVWRRNLGAGRSERGWPWASLAESGARLAFGSDWPVVPLDPFTGISLATTRHRERLDLAQAVEAWTSGSAYAEHADGLKGTIQTGMLADIAVLDQDLESIAADDVGSMKVRTTIVGGKVVYET